MGTKKGFSLLEVMMALFVLSIGVTGVLSLMTNSITNSNDARDAIVAAQLAQEGIELIRNKRDSNVAVNPTADVFSGISNDNDCRIDISSSLACNQTTYSLGYIAAQQRQLVHSGGTATKFSRKIITSSPSVNEKKVGSFVWWGSVVPTQANGSDCLNINKCIYAEAILTNWEQE